MARLTPVLDIQVHLSPSLSWSSPPRLQNRQRPHSGSRDLVSGKKRAQILSSPKPRRHSYYRLCPFLLPAFLNRSACPPPSVSQVPAYSTSADVLGPVKLSMCQDMLPSNALQPGVSCPRSLFSLMAYKQSPVSYSTQNPQFNPHHCQVHLPQV